MYRRDTLSNGVRIITERLPYVRSISVGFWVGVGGRDEDGVSSGASHFVEHMLFKGTTTRSARDIAEAIDGVGGQLDAFTTKEYTCYYARTLDEHLPLSLEILWDMLSNSILNPEDIEREKGVILEEINMYEDSPDELIHDLFMAALWDGHPLSESTLGTPETVKGMNRETLLSHIERYYTPENMVIAAAGNVDHDELMELCERYVKVGGVKRGDRKREVATPQPRIVVKTKPTEQIHLMVGVPGVCRNDPAKYPLGIIDNIIGGSMSSRLFQRLREERGLVYNVYSYMSMFHDTGYFAIYAGTSFANARDVIDIILDEMGSFWQRGISDTELIRAKEQLKGNLILSLESTTNRMNRLGLSEIFQEGIYTPDEIMQKIDSVTKDDVLSLAERIFQKGRRAVAIIGPEGQGDEVKGWIGS